MRNIYVSAEEPTVVTGSVDWQSTSIEPAFIYANETPDSASLPEVSGEDTFENEQKIPDHRRKEWKDASICHQTYDICIKGLIPKLRPARLLDPCLFQLFYYRHASWRDSATALRRELLELSIRWTELGLQGSCPYEPSEEELEEHVRDYEDLETVRRPRSWLQQFLGTNFDGWVSNEDWDDARDAHRAVYDEWIRTAREAEARWGGLTVAKADNLWPFHAR
jgi:hypothetical protein